MCHWNLPFVAVAVFTMCLLVLMMCDAAPRSQKKRIFQTESCTTWLYSSPCFSFASCSHSLTPASPSLSVHIDRLPSLSTIINQAEVDLWLYVTVLACQICIYTFITTKLGASLSQPINKFIFDRIKCVLFGHQERSSNLMFLTSVLKDFIFIGAKQNQHNKNCHKLSDRSLLLFPLSRSLILFFSSHLLLSVHLFLVEPHYPCYLRQLSLSGCVLLTSHTGSCVGWLGEGRSRERREEVDRKSCAVALRGCFYVRRSGAVFNDSLFCNCPDGLLSSVERR